MSDGRTHAATLSSSHTVKSSRKHEGGGLYFPQLQAPPRPRPAPDGSGDKQRPGGGPQGLWLQFRAGTRSPPGHPGPRLGQDSTLRRPPRVSERLSGGWEGQQEGAEHHQGQQRTLESDLALAQHILGLPAPGVALLLLTGAFWLTQARAMHLWGMPSSFQPNLGTGDLTGSLA